MGGPNRAGSPGHPPAQPPKGDSSLTSLHTASALLCGCKPTGALWMGIGEF